MYGLCLGYEVLNDHDDLRHAPLLAVLVGKSDPTGQNRGGRDREKPLAGKSTLNRLELTPVREWLPPSALSRPPTPCRHSTPCRPRPTPVTGTLAAARP